MFLLTIGIKWRVEMRRVPRNKAIDIVLTNHIKTITDWATNDRIALKNWLYKILNLGRMSVEDMKEEFPTYFPNEEDGYEDD